MAARTRNCSEYCVQINRATVQSGRQSARQDDKDNTIHGNSGDNVVKGLLGSDDLFGHKGNDILTGGGDVDRFHFLTGDGKDVVTDFENTFDQVDVSGWDAITDFNDLMQHHIQFKNGDAIITAGQDRLTLENLAEADVDVGDFIFAI